MDEVYELTAKTPEELLTEQINILNTLTEVVREVVEASSLDIDPDNYFIWMYSVEPFPEAQYVTVDDRGDKEKGKVAARQSHPSPCSSAQSTLDRLC